MMTGISEPVTPWPIRDSEAFDLHSDAVGDTFAIGVVPPIKLPEAINNPVGLPRLVYVLDGALALGAAAMIAMTLRFDVIRPGFPPLLLVGIDYPIGQPNCRSRDYTMHDSVWPAMRPGLEMSPSTAPGGADAFLRFLEDELDPLIRSRYQVNEAPAGILGDSFGGTFTFYAFLRQSRLFDRYWLGSPGVFTTETDYVEEFAKVVNSELVNDTRMYLSLGELEATGGVDFYADMGANFKRIVDALDTSANKRLNHKAHVYPGHTHTSVLAPALNDALLYLYGEA